MRSKQLYIDIEIVISRNFYDTDKARDSWNFLYRTHGALFLAEKRAHVSLRPWQTIRVTVTAFERYRTYDNFFVENNAWFCVAFDIIKVFALVF